MSENKKLINRFIIFITNRYFDATCIYRKSPRYVLRSFLKDFLRNEGKPTLIQKWITRDKSCAPNKVEEKSFSWTTARRALVIQFSFISTFLPYEEKAFSPARNVSLGLPYHPFPTWPPRWSKHRLRRIRQ